MKHCYRIANVDDYRSKPSETISTEYWLCFCRKTIPLLHHQIFAYLVLFRSSPSSDARGEVIYTFILKIVCRVEYFLRYIFTESCFFLLLIKLKIVYTKNIIFFVLMYTYELLQIKRLMSYKIKIKPLKYFKEPHTTKEIKKNRQQLIILIVRTTDNTTGKKPARRRLN